MTGERCGTQGHREVSRETIEQADYLAAATRIGAKRDRPIEPRVASELVLGARRGGRERRPSKRYVTGVCPQVRESVCRRRPGALVSSTRRKVSYPSSRFRCTIARGWCRSRERAGGRVRPFVLSVHRTLELVRHGCAGAATRLCRATVTDWFRGRRVRARVYTTCTTWAPRRRTCRWTDLRRG